MYAYEIQSHNWAIYTEENQYNSVFMHAKNC